MLGITLDYLLPSACSSSLCDSALSTLGKRRDCPSVLAYCVLLESQPHPNTMWSGEHRSFAAALPVASEFTAACAASAIIFCFTVPSIRTCGCCLPCVLNMETVQNIVIRSCLLSLQQLLASWLTRKKRSSSTFRRKGTHVPRPCSVWSLLAKIQRQGDHFTNVPKTKVVVSMRLEWVSSLPS